jgi:hypothetical protein
LINATVGILRSAISYSEVYNYILRYCNVKGKTLGRRENRHHAVSSLWTDGIDHYDCC